ncbi:MAG: gamma carbonic anhydrase family protein [Bacteroidota bacterium]
MISPFLNHAPRYDETNFIAKTAIVLGNVTLGAHASIWYGASLRGDVHWIEIGAESNAQDNVTIHVSRGTHPCHVHERVTIGHNAVVHGAVVESDCLIGMGAIVLDGSVIGAGSLVGAGAVVTPNTVVPPRSLVLGQPGRVVRTLSDEEVDRNRANAAHYVRMSAMYRGKVLPEMNPFYKDRRE